MTAMTIWLFHSSAPRSGVGRCNRSLDLPALGIMQFSGSHFMPQTAAQYPGAAGLRVGLDDLDALFQP